MSGDSTLRGLLSICTDYRPDRCGPVLDLRRPGGVRGFLLRVTDVERQPFRSMGFVSVIIVSGLFALGLPLVLV